MASKPTKRHHRMQEIVMVAGVPRFRANKIVRDLLDFASERGLDLNVLARKGYSDDDWAQFTQQIGYSVSGWGELSHSPRSQVRRADAIADRMVTEANMVPLVHAAMSGDDLAARQWVKDAKRAGVDLGSLPRPNLGDDMLSVAACIAEMFARRYGKPDPHWTSTVGPASERVFLCSDSPMMRRICLEHSPEVFRKRNVFAFGADYLNVL